MHVAMILCIHVLQHDLLKCLRSQRGYYKTKRHTVHICTYVINRVENTLELSAYRQVQIYNVQTANQSTYIRSGDAFSIVSVVCIKVHLSLLATYHTCVYVRVHT